MKTKFDLKKQISKGKLGEELFQKRFPKATREKGRRARFTTPNGKKLDLKSDSYDRPNFFMERYSCLQKKTPGGPWQSLINGADFLVYQFTEKKEVFFFPINDLVKFLDANLNKFEKKVIESHGWSAMGYLVPKKAVLHLAKKLDLKT